jgi:intergrase/recombinase
MFSQKILVLVRSPGFEPGSSAWETSTDGSLANRGLEIDFQRVRGDFITFLESRRLTSRYLKSTITYLDKYMRVIRGPMDVVRIFSGLTVGQKHNLIRGVQNLFSFLRAQGFSRDYLDVLRMNLPKDEVGFDLRIPSEEEIVKSLRVISETCLKYKALYSLVVDSGLRLVEACRLISSFGELQVERFDGFCVVPLGYFRRSKLAYFGLMTDYTFKLVDQVKEEIDWESAVTYIRKRPGVVSFKYLRKFANDTMTNDELNIPESVADFIQGRTPKSVGARHYMQLKRKAIQFYPRYAKYVTELRRKAALTA